MHSCTRTAERVYRIQNTCLRHNKEGDIETLPYVVRLIAVLALLQEIGWKPKEQIRLGWLRLGADPNEKPKTLVEWVLRFFRKPELPLDTLERLGPIFAQLDSKDKQRLNNDAKFLLIDLTKGCTTDFLETDMHERHFINGVGRKKEVPAINDAAKGVLGISVSPPQSREAAFN